MDFESDAWKNQTIVEASAHHFTITHNKSGVYVNIAHSGYGIDGYRLEDHTAGHDYNIYQQTVFFKGDIDKIDDLITTLQYHKAKFLGEI